MKLSIGPADFELCIENGWLTSLGRVSVHGVSLRASTVRFLPWFDSYEGEVFRRFRFQKVEKHNQSTVIHTWAVSDPDTLFRERRDTSGDVALRAASWDSPAVEIPFRIVIAPVEEMIDGRPFVGFKYWFECDSPEIPFHRLMDRQTWELGGNLDDVTLCLRHWHTPPYYRVKRDNAFSTVGMGHVSGLMPGNLWARWGVLPAFDMQHGPGGVLLAWFDRVSLIRGVVETQPGDDFLKVVDFHYFEKTNHFQTNAKTVVWSPEVLDKVDALNLWTRMTDRENVRARNQFGIPEEEPPAIIFYDYHWVGYHLSRSYEETLNVAAEFGGDMLFIDSLWESRQTTTEEIAAHGQEAWEGTTVGKLYPGTMCETKDFQIARHWGGEEELKKLCDRAREKGLKIISWTGLHGSTNSTRWQELADASPDNRKWFCQKESGYHPDSGYPFALAPLNLNNQKLFEYTRDQWIGVCQRTGLAGFFWDSFCNLGWWGVDYAAGDFRPQFDRVAGVYADLVKAGLYVMPEAVPTFSSHAYLNICFGDIYEGDSLGFSYNMNTDLWFGEGDPAGPEFRMETRILMGIEPLDMLFRSFAHKRAAAVVFHKVPRDKWNPQAVREIKDLFAAYRKVRHLMKKRTVLKGDSGVLWESSEGKVFWSFKNQTREGVFTDVLDGGKTLRANRVYFIQT